MRKIVAVIAVACALCAHAEERTVSTAAELYEALLALNSGSDTGNVIYLEPGSYDVSDYAMKKWNRTAVSSETVSHIALGNVTIRGLSDDPRDTVIYCNGTNRVIHSQASHIECLTVSNGWINTTSGGAGVQCADATSDNQKSFHSNVVVTCCTAAAFGGGVNYGVWYDSAFVSNSMVNASAAGGGALGVTCHNCVISNNYSAGDGGACAYKATLFGCRVLDNIAAKTGGGLYGSSCTNIGGVIAGNRSGGNGGGAYDIGLVDGTVVSNNFAGASGGGICFIGRYLATNCVICCNESVAYGGGLNGGLGYCCTITCNKSQAYGGGVCEAECHDCEISHNSSPGYGGGVYYEAKLYDCRVFGNASTGENGKNGSGGGVASNGSATHACHIYGGVISNNTAATNGGGVYFCILHGGTVVCGNLAGNQGGGVYNGAGTAATNTVICCNEAHGSNSGGICAYNSLAVGCVVSNNFLNSSVDKAASGGGMYAGGGLVIDSKIVFNRIANSSTHKDARAYGAGAYGGALSNCFIAGNAVIQCATTTRQGGGCYSSVLTNCIVVDNFVYDGLGTGINSGSAYGCVISNNASTGKAPAVRSTTRLVNCEIFGSLTAPRQMINCRVVGFTNGVVIAEGANVYTNGSFAGYDYLCEGEAYATNCLFAGNTTVYGIFHPTTTNGAYFANCTVADNISQRIVYDANTTKPYPAELANCIVTGNKWNGADRNMWYDTAHTNITLRNCLIGPGRPSARVLHEENTVTNGSPKFVADGSRDSYALKRSSPAVGQGLVQDWMTDATDIRQDPACPRLRDGKVDIGCYQCWLDPVGFLFSIW